MNTRDDRLISEAYENISQKSSMTNTNTLGTKEASPAEAADRQVAVSSQKNVVARFKQNGWTEVKGNQNCSVLKRGSDSATVFKNDLVDNTFEVIINGEDLSSLPPEKLDDQIINPRRP